MRGRRCQELQQLDTMMFSLFLLIAAYSQCITEAQAEFNHNANSPGRCRKYIGTGYCQDVLDVKLARVKGDFSLDAATKLCNETPGCLHFSRSDDGKVVQMYRLTTRYMWSCTLRGGKRYKNVKVYRMDVFQKDCEGPVQTIQLMGTTALSKVPKNVAPLLGTFELIHKKERDNYLLHSNQWLSETPAWSRKDPKSGKTIYLYRYMNSGRWVIKAGKPKRAHDWLKFDAYMYCSKMVMVNGRKRRRHCSPLSPVYRGECICKWSTQVGGKYLPANVDVVPVTACQPNPCANGGRCTLDKGETFVCTCAVGFTGKKCTVPDVHPCDREDNAGCSQNCRGKGQSYECYCDEGFTIEADKKTCVKNWSADSPDPDCLMRGSYVQGSSVFTHMGVNWKECKGLCDKQDATGQKCEWWTWSQSEGQSRCELLKVNRGVGTFPELSEDLISGKRDCP